MTEWQKIESRRLDVIHSRASKPGLRGKIDAMCCSCIYDPTQLGNWRKQVEKCTSKACPLYPVRPTSNANKEGEYEHPTL